MPTRDIRVEAMTENLGPVMRELAELIAGQAEEGARYAVTIMVTGPLTVEEAVTALWERVRRVQIPAGEHVS